MQLREYQQCLAAVPFGKRLPTAIYVLREPGLDCGPGLNRVVAILEEQHQLGAEFNVIKFRIDELKVSFLSYPYFMEDAHPALRDAVTIDLVSGRVRRSDYSGNLNPPILHRKELFLPLEHPARARFESLTNAEEAAGLYEHPATIGFKLNWERLLAVKGFRIVDHSLLWQELPDAVITDSISTIERHKTALTRYELSKPVKTLIEYAMLKPGSTFLDYGCGQGSDVHGLQALGYQAEGWDPVHRPHGVKRNADIVNLGYVLNVIEDPAERVEALIEAHRHANRLLVVSALITETVETDRATKYRDGVRTQRNTFQKYFEQQELQQYLEDALDSTAVPVALGVFYVFRNPADQQDFLSARSRRSIDWTRISARLGLGAPGSLWRSLYDEHRDVLDAFGKLTLQLGRFPAPTEFPPLTTLIDRLGSEKRALRAFVQGGGVQGIGWDEVRLRFGIGLPPKRRWERLYEDHRQLLDAFWSLMLQLGRLPEPDEFPRFSELREKIGSPKQALRLFIQKGGDDDVKRAAENRRRDLLVYVALANLRKRVPFGHLSATLRADIRAFFGNYTRALEKGLELLYAAGDTGEIELACEDLKLGWQDEQALYLHRSLLDDLPPVLRAYVGCATTLFGDVSQADVIKLHKASGKATFLLYDDFEGNPLPELRLRIKVNLRTRWVQVFDHSAERQVLCFKERLLSPDHPRRSDMQAFSVTLRDRGFDAATVGPGPLRPELYELLVKQGLKGKLGPLPAPDGSTIATKVHAR